MSELLRYHFPVTIAAVVEEFALGPTIKVKHPDGDYTTNPDRRSIGWRLTLSNGLSIILPEKPDATSATLILELSK